MTDDGHTSPSLQHHVVMEVTLPGVDGHGDTHVRTSITSSIGGGGNNNDKRPSITSTPVRRSSVRDTAVLPMPIIPATPVRDTPHKDEPPSTPPKVLDVVPLSPLPPPTLSPIIVTTESKNAGPVSPIVPVTPPLTQTGETPPPSTSLLADHDHQSHQPMENPPTSPPLTNQNSLTASGGGSGANGVMSTPRRVLRPSPEEEHRSGAGPTSPFMTQPTEREGVPLLRIDTDDHTAGGKMAPNTPSANGRDWENQHTPTSRNNNRHQHGDDSDTDDDEGVALPRPSFTAGVDGTLIQHINGQAPFHATVAAATAAAAAANNRRLSFEDGTESVSLSMSMGIPPTPTAKRPRFADDDDDTANGTGAQSGNDNKNKNIRDEDDDLPSTAPPGAFHRLRFITLLTVLFEAALVATCGYATSMRGEATLMDQLSPTLIVFTILYAIGFIAVTVECYRLFVATPFPLVPSWNWHHWSAVRSGFIAFYTCGFFYPQIMVYLFHSRGSNITSLYFDLDHDLQVDIAYHAATFVAVFICSLATFGLIYHTFQTRFLRNAHTEGWDEHGPPPVSCAYSVAARVLVFLSIGSQAAYTYGLVSAAVRTLNEGTFICAAIYILSVIAPLFYGIRLFLVPAKREYFFRTLRIAHLAHIFFLVATFWITLLLYLLDKQYDSGFFGAVRDLPSSRAAIIWTQIGFFVMFIIMTAYKMYIHKFRRINSSHPHATYTSRDMANTVSVPPPHLRGVHGKKGSVELHALHQASSSSNMYGGNGLAALRDAHGGSGRVTQSSQRAHPLPSPSSKEIIARSSEPILV